MILEFARQNVEKSSNIILMKVSPVGTELFHTDGRTDMTKLIVAFRKVENAPKSSAGIYRVLISP